MKILPKQSGAGKTIYLLSFFFLTFLLGFNFKSTAQTDLVVSTPLCFSVMDNDPDFDDDAIAGQITLNSLIIQDGGSISYNDPGSPCSNAGVPNDPAGSVHIIVTEDFEMQNNSFIYTENRIQGGKGGNITLTVLGGNFLMKSGSLISSSNLTATSGDRSAGDMAINVAGTVTMDAGSEIRANSAHGNGGDIELISGQSITINGKIISKELSSQSGSGTNQAHGGMIWLQAPGSIFVGDLGIISSRGFDAGADLVHLCACEITIYGLVESSASGHAIPSNPPNHLANAFRPDKDPSSTAGVEIWATGSIVIDNLNHNGRVNADLCCAGGTEGESWIDIFSKEGNITIIGKTVADNLNIQNTNFAVHANGAAGNSDNGGTITIKALEGEVTASGLAVQADGTKIGGEITIEAKGDVDLTGGTSTARGYSVNNTNGGTINIRSFGTAPNTGDILADAASRLNVTGGNPTADGVINLTACGTIGFPPGITVPAGATVNTVTGTCDGNPSLDTQPYVIFCGGAGNLTIYKVFTNANPASNPINDWQFTISPSVGGVSSFSIAKTGGSYVFNGVPDGIYTVTELAQTDPHCIVGANYVVSNSCGPNFTGAVAEVTVAGCQGGSCTFFNLPPSCEPRICDIITTNEDTTVCPGSTIELCAPEDPDFTYLWSTGETTRCITVGSGTYSVVITDENGSTSSCFKEITLLTPPPCTITGNNYFCPGLSTELCAPEDPDFTYVWSTGETTRCITVSIAGEYTVTVTDENGCSSTCPKTIVQNPTLTVTCSGNNMTGTLTAHPVGGTPGYTYLWNTVPPQITQSITVTDEETYQVIVTDSKGCKDTTECHVNTCNGFRTQTQGGWGAPPQGNNPAKYMTRNFAGAFPSPNYLTIGCETGNKLMLTTAKAVTDFLPSGSTPSALPAGTLVNPGQTYQNVFAGQLVAVTLNIQFDLYDPNFSPSPINLVDLIINSGTFAGWTVGQVVEEANKKIGGCASAFSFSDLNNVLDAINNNYDNKNVNQGNLSCPGTFPLLASRGVSTLTNVDNRPVLPSKVNASVYPNPFSSTTMIRFETAIGSSHAKVEVYNLTGIKVATIFDHDVKPGTVYNAIFNGRGLGQGMYIYKIINGKKITNGKLIKLDD